MRIHNYGGPEVLSYEDAPSPQLQAGDILVKTGSAGVNPLDWKVRQGFIKLQPPRDFPTILGWDVSGVVTACAADVDRFKVGDAVFAHCDRSREGAYAEFVAVRAEEAALAPSTLPLAAVAGAPLAALTAWTALFDSAGLVAGQRVLIHAGAGGVGSFAVQLAKRAGAHVVSTASGDGVDIVRQFGADEVVDYRSNDFALAVQGMDVVLDTVGGETLGRSVACLKRGGVLVSVTGVLDKAVADAAGIRAVFAAVRPNGARLAEIAHALEEGALKLPAVTSFPLQEAAAAQVKIATGRTRGKIVLEVGT